MDVFIDTSILYDDPFWQNNYNKALLDRAKKGKLNLHLSNVVTKELHRNFQKQIDEQIKQLNDVLTTINRKFTPEKISISIPNKDELIKKFKSFYSALVEDGIINIISFDDSYLTEIIERAVWRRKPFTESKTELKDTVIWLSYAKYVNDKQIETPYFLTTNINDFCKSAAKETKVLEVHDELKKDCDRIKVFKYTKDFISEVIEKIESENKTKFKEIAKEKINEDFITDIIYKWFSKELEDEVIKYIDTHFDAKDIFNIDYFFTGYMDSKIIGWGIKCKELRIDLLDEYAIVSGYETLEIEVEAYEYNAGRDSGEDRHNYYGAKEIFANAFFSFALDPDFMPYGFEITDVKIEKQ
jgi:hypothetical protein